MSLLNPIVRLIEGKKGTGALPDLRSEWEKQKDYTFAELVASAEPVQWVEKPRDRWRKFPISNQNGSGSCVAQTMAKLLGVLYWQKTGTFVPFSATHIYQRRSNKPAGGMNGVEAFDIARRGATLEVLAPSQSMTDSQMDSAKVERYKEEVGEVFKLANYMVLPMKDIETVASTIQKTGKAVMVWFYFQGNEWTDIPTIKNTSLSLAGGLRHSVTAVDFTLYKGKKALIIEDSWGKTYGFEGQRVITEDFYQKRNFFAAYPLAFRFDDQLPNKPRYTFTKTLTLSDVRELDVIALQNILKHEGLFPSNVDSTGIYGAVTAKAVLAFQKKHKVAPDTELDLLQGRRVGEKTLDKLNELYSS
jgi:hypothetical protein